MNQQREDNIRRLLNNIEQVENVPQQMFEDFGEDEDGKQTGGWWAGQPAATGGASASATSTHVVDSWEELEDDTGNSNIKKEPETAVFKSSIRNSSQKNADQRNSDSDFAWGSGSGGFSHRPSSSQALPSTSSTSAASSRPSTSQGLPRVPSSGMLEGGDDDMDLEEDVPQVAGLLEYNRAHGDIIYLDDELGEGSIYCQTTFLQSL